jgi:hypothetical protein
MYLKTSSLSRKERHPLCLPNMILIKHIYIYIYIIWIIFDNCMSALTVFHHLTRVKYKLTEKKILNNPRIAIVNDF